MISVEDARDRVLAIAHRTGPEAIALRDGAGRVLAADVVARRDQPPFDASAMDGYAITGEDHRPGQVLAVTGEAAAGHRYAGRVGPGEAVRIFTGAPVPEGATRVVIQEDVDRSGDRITLRPAPGAQTNIRPRGQDFRTGDRLAAPRRLTAEDLSLAAAMNVAELTVARRPVVAILQTGDELVAPGEDPADDQIIASVAPALAALAAAAGAEPRILPIAPDDHAAIAFALGLCEGADVVVTVGGASVGDHDLVGAVAAGRGLERAFWKIAMRPGKPLMAGRMGEAVFLGLPGNPVSALVCARLFLQPLLARLQGLPPDAAGPRLLPGALGCDMPANGPRAHFMRARLEPGPVGMVLHPFGDQDSSRLGVLSAADALLLRPVDAPPARAGDPALYLPF